MDQEFSKLLVSKSGAWSEIYLSTRTNIYDNSIGSSGMVVFIALYLGMVFIISGNLISCQYNEIFYHHFSINLGLVILLSIFYNINKML